MLRAKGIKSRAHLSVLINGGVRHKTCASCWQLTVKLINKKTFSAFPISISSCRLCVRKEGHCKKNIPLIFKSFYARQKSRPGNITKLQGKSRKHGMAALVMMKSSSSPIY
jgi:hypothetical protein